MRKTAFFGTLALALVSAWLTGCPEDDPGPDAGKTLDAITRPDLDVGVNVGGESSPTGDGAPSGPDYVGTWIRAELLLNGAPQTFAPSTLNLTVNTFQNLAPTSLCKEVSGDVEVKGDQMTWTTKKLVGPSYCGAVGTVTVATYKVAGGKLTLVSSQSGGTVKETYNAK